MGGIGVEFDGVILEVRYASYLEQTSSEVLVASERRELKIDHDGTVQINFGFLF